MKLFLFLAIALATVVVLFAVQNSALIKVSFLTFHFEGSLAFVLVVVFAAGLITGVLASLPSLLRKSMALREQKKRVKQLEERTVTPSPPSSHGGYRDN